jgi:omega-6 fatty acid desaturase (delta-12 desaturase)
MISRYRAAMDRRFLMPRVALHQHGHQLFYAMLYLAPGIGHIAILHTMMDRIMDQTQPSFEINQQVPPQDSQLPEHSEGVRIGDELMRATAPYASEQPARSWWQVGSTFVLMVAVLGAAGLASWWPLRLALSVLGGLLMVRAFVTYHDYMHLALLRDSRLAWLLFRLYAVLALTPPRSWSRSHNYHHSNVGKISIASIGAFPVITTKMWRDASPWGRGLYRMQRHPLMVVFGYITIFAFSICFLPLLRDPKQYWDAALVLIGHGTLIAVLWWFGGFDTAFFVILLPMTIASALGSYVFFAQHSFKRMHIISPESWNFYRAALESSSYMRLNRVMQWFTGNIGYHHIHHLNVRIPFYRLPEAMAAIPELQSPVTTTLRPRDIIDCFRACLWDEQRQRMVTYREASRHT